ncbi:hypothetical protein MGYG_09214 [Nannizzia gypsea CBS 118893]|uniref:Uncharacterized protein n=1 Tax=Arthroderma gypseum (strain ATCC MYA-4604 / CBS 118893) TaxID=535722 RepID=E4V787_ARTGP|nr:hypothetical protein MGYG_09214 [Nannizzia gypsea CBS 118893]EFQ96953.1 hypothetical protein MGYG_09214 [Nannizzia gypsea CBS 118893]
MLNFSATYLLENQTIWEKIAHLVLYRITLEFFKGEGGLKLLKEEIEIFNPNLKDLLPKDLIWLFRKEELETRSKGLALIYLKEKITLRLILVNKALRKILGTFKTSPTYKIEIEASIPPIRLNLNYLEGKKGKKEEEDLENLIEIRILPLPKEEVKKEYLELLKDILKSLENLIYYSDRSRLEKGTIGARIFEYITS